MSILQLLLIVVFSASAYAGHWTDDGTPLIDVGTSTAPPFDGALGGSATATVTTDQNAFMTGQVEASSKSVFESAQNSSSRSGTYYKKSMWVGSGQGYAQCRHHVDSYLTMDLKNASCALYGLGRATSSVDDTGVDQDPHLYKVTKDADNLGEISIKLDENVTVTMPIPPAGSSITESYLLDYPSDDTSGDGCGEHFWEKRIVFGYVNGVADAIIDDDASVCGSVMAWASTEASLVRPCPEQDTGYHAGGGNPHSYHL